MPEISGCLSALHSNFIKTHLNLYLAGKNFTLLFGYGYANYLINREVNIHSPGQKNIGLNYQQYILCIQI
jgi:hypothetical protein